MRPDFYNLDVPSSPGAGAALPASEYIDKTVQVFGTFTGLNLHIEGTLDGTNWDAVTGSISTTDIVALPQILKSIRVRLVALTSGAPAVKFAGRLAR